MKVPYNGHESKTAWNVALWIGNDYGLYQWAIELKQQYPKTAARKLFEGLGGKGAKTPDGFAYSIRTIRLALEGLE